MLESQTQEFRPVSQRSCPALLVQPSFLVHLSKTGTPQNNERSKPGHRGVSVPAPEPQVTAHLKHTGTLVSVSEPFTGVT